MMAKNGKVNGKDTFEYKPTSSYRWCKNEWLTLGTKLDPDLNVYVSNNTYHYMGITFDDRDNISEIVFYFDCKN